MNSTAKQILVSLSVESETALNTLDHIPVVGTLILILPLRLRVKRKLRSSVNQSGTNVTDLSTGIQLETILCHLKPSSRL